MTTLEMLNPADLLTDRNVRTDPHLTPAFIGSVKANGIIVPIVAIRDPEGIRVRAGHRRTAAALHAGLVEVLWRSLSPWMVMPSTRRPRGTTVATRTQISTVPVCGTTTSGCGAAAH